MAKDPVCGMMVDESKTNLSTTYKNKTYYFCSQECKRKFDTTINNLKKAGGGICYGVRIEDDKQVDV